MTQRDESARPPLDPEHIWITAGGRQVHVPLSLRPADFLTIEVDRERRQLVIREPNGAEYRRVDCPAVAAGARPEDLQ